MKNTFPELPSYKFAWRSIQVEPVPLSGERITMAMLVKGEDEQFLAARVIPNARLQRLFGKEFGKHLNDALEVCIISAEKYFDSRSIDQNWSPSIEGFFIGKTQYSLATSFEEGIMVAASHSSSFSFALKAEKAALEEKGIEKITPKDWRRAIFQAVTKKNERLSAFFDKETPVRGAGVPIRFDFLSEPYAAQFESVTDVTGVHSALVRSQSKLWQLDRLRDQQSLFGNKKCELLLRKPSQKTLLGQEPIEEFAEELKYEAAKREISLFTTDSLDEAVLHVISQAA